MHSGHWGINPSLKNSTPLFLATPPLNQQTVPPPPSPLFRQSPPIYWFFKAPLKVRSFSETKNIKVFHP